MNAGAHRMLDEIDRFVFHAKILWSDYRSTQTISQSKKHFVEVLKGFFSRKDSKLGFDFHYNWSRMSSVELHSQLRPLFTGSIAIVVPECNMEDGFESDISDFVLSMIHKLK